MKKEELIALGIDEEVAKQIMSINGKDIEKAKSSADKDSEKLNQKIQNLESELKSKDELIANANSEIEKFKELDVEGIKKQAEEWKTKYTEFENQTKAEKEALEKQLADKEYDFTMREMLNNHKFSSDWAKEQFIKDLKAKEFELVDGKITGAEEYINEFKIKNAGVFATEEVKTPMPEIVKGTGGQAPKAKMSLMEMMKMKNDNPNAQLPIE